MNHMTHPFVWPTFYIFCVSQKWIHISLH